MWKEKGIYKGPLSEGFYVYSSCGCEDDCAIRMEHVQTPEDVASFSFSPNFARALGELLIEVANQYDQGIQTGIDGEEYFNEKRDDLLKKLKELPSGDEERDHSKADALLLEFINDEKISIAFESIPKWYA